MTTLKEALEQGLSRYFTGRACKHGHIAERMTKNRTCVECKRIMSASWVSNNKDKQSKRTRSWYERNKESTNERATSWRLANPEKHNESKRNYYKNNLEKELNRSRQRKCKVNFTSFSYEEKELAEFYNNRPKGHHVDHIIPLQHHLICGLHCLANLQYLTASENSAKSNKWPNNYSNEDG